MRVASFFKTKIDLYLATMIVVFVCVGAALLSYGLSRPLPSYYVPTANVSQWHSLGTASVSYSRSNQPTVKVAVWACTLPDVNNTYKETVLAVASIDQPYTTGVRGKATLYYQTGKDGSLASKAVKTYTSTDWWEHRYQSFSFSKTAGSSLSKLIVVYQLSPTKGTSRLSIGVTPAGICDKVSATDFACRHY